MEFIVAIIVSSVAFLTSLGALDSMERGSLIRFNNGKVEYHDMDRLGEGEMHFKRLVEHAAHVEHSHPEHAHAKWHEVASYVSLHNNEWTEPTLLEVNKHLEEIKEKGRKFSILP